MTSQRPEPEIKPTTIFRHAFGIYPPIAMLAGMQLNVFTPLVGGPMTDAELAKALNLRTEKLRPLLYALVDAALLEMQGDRFANTPESDLYLVRGRATYLGSAHELYSDLWRAALASAESIRSGAPQAKHDFSAMSHDDLAAFFRGLHAGALATGRQLVTSYEFGRFHRLLDVGGGSGGLAIAACQNCPDLDATVIELPRVAPITRSFIEEAKLVTRVRVQTVDVLTRAPEGRFDVTVLRNLIQVLGADQARAALRHVGEAIEPDGFLFIVGHVLEDSRVAIWAFETYLPNLICKTLRTGCAIDASY